MHPKLFTSVLLHHKHSLIMNEDQSWICRETWPLEVNRYIDMISHGDVWEKLVHTTEKAIPGSLQAWELVVCLIPGPQSPRTGDADGAVLIEPTGLRSPGATRPVPGVQRLETLKSTWVRAEDCACSRRGRKSFFFFFLAPSRLPDCWMAPAYMEVTSPPTQPTNSLLVSPRHTLTDTPRNATVSVVCVFLNPIKLTPKINCCCHSSSPCWSPGP